MGQQGPSWAVLNKKYRATTVNSVYSCTWWVVNWQTTQLSNLAQLPFPQVVRSMAKGPSAGQSTMIILFDQFLGITHFNKEGGEAGPFQEEM